MAFSENNINYDEHLEANKDLQRMIEDVENRSVQLTWMAYDMAALRTSPLRADSMLQLEDAYQRCRAAVRGEPEPEQECPGTAEATLAQM